jgi:UDP:flavonoid glycosyltransferase YjiC (YdhE family)
VARIALSSGTDRGHTYPVVAVARALADRGHDAIVLTGRERGPELDAAGITWTPLPDLGEATARRGPFEGLWSHAAAAAPPTAALLRRLGIEVVVSDVLMATGGLAAELCDLPWVEIVPHHLDDPAVELPPMGLGRLPSRAPWVRLDDRLIHLRTARSRAAGRADRAAARSQLGLAGEGGPVARLVASLPGLEYPRRVWPADAHLVGPLAWDPPAVGLASGGPGGAASATGAAMAAERALAGIDPDGPPVVLAVDSTGTGARGGLAALAVEALAGLDLQLIATTGRREVAVRAAHRWPLGCVVAPLPHDRPLEFAAVAVSPGGAGFLGKALLRGVPLTVVPDTGDQFEAAARVVWSGAGRRVDLRAPWTPHLPDPVGQVGQLRRSVVRLLADDRYARAAGRLAEEAATRGPTVAAEIVEHALAGTLPTADGPTR